MSKTVPRQANFPAQSIKNEITRRRIENCQATFSSAQFRSHEGNPAVQNFCSFAILA